MSRTQTPAPEDPKMWRRLVARAHPDAGGDGELFVWANSVREVICSGELRAGTWTSPAPADDVPRIPYPTGADFGEITRRALERAGVEDVYGRVLSLLADCEPLEHLAYEQDRGASYKRLAAIAHAWGMTKAERVGWYRVAEDLSLSDRHAGHILAKLKKRAA
jgi:hypothetical protein